LPFKVLFMKKEQDYKKDISEIRAMMERSSRFMSLSGWAGILAGLYALTGTGIAYFLLGFWPAELSGNAGGTSVSDLKNLILLAIIILVLAVGTAVLLSARKARIKSESVWNASSRRLLVAVSIPLFSGGLLILVFISLGLYGLLAPLTLLFYGMALYNAGNFTYKEVRILGLILIVLGLLS